MPLLRPLESCLHEGLRPPGREDGDAVLPRHGEDDDDVEEEQSKVDLAALHQSSSSLVDPPSSSLLFSLAFPVSTVHCSIT